MPGRSGFVARAADLSDLGDLAELCLTARNESSASKSVLPPDPAKVRQYLRGLFGETGAHVDIVTREGTAAGLVISRTVSPGPFYDEPRVQIEAIYVEPGSRRKGAGHALLGRISEHAAAAHAPEVICLPLIGSRALPRFFARVGFAPVGSHRTIPADVLARKVTREPAIVVGHEERRRGLEELIARRRRTRETGEIPVTPGYPAAPGSERSKQVKRAVASRRSASS